LHPRVSQATQLLHRHFNNNSGYDVQVVSEAGKLNLNWLLLESAANQPTPTAIAKLAIFKHYLARHGLEIEEGQRLVDCMLDWIDTDNLHRMNGAEDEPNYRPPNRGAFISVDEIAQIKGSKPLVSKPDWKDDLTIFSQPGTIDLQSAPESVLECLPNVGEANAQRLVQFRRGADKLDGTADDHIFKNVNEALQYLGVAGAAAQILQPLVMVEAKPSILHITSTGRFGKVDRQVETVAAVQGGQPNFFWWKEL